MTRWPSALAALMVLHGAPALAHGLCGNRLNIIAQLEFRYGEARQDGRLPSSIMPLELYASGLNGTWTILRAHPPDRFCVEASGTNWNGKLPRLPEPSGDPV